MVYCQQNSNDSSVLCSITGQPFRITSGEQRLVREFNLPLPQRSAFERWIYALGQSTPFVFRKISCPVTKKPILTRWSEEGCINGVSPEWFWSDECDNRRAGIQFDFSRTFFEQFCEVARDSFAPSVNHFGCENSPYVNASYHLKNCHLCFACEQSNDCLYCVLCAHSTDLLLCCGVKKSELCYSCLDSENLYDCRFVQDSKNCSNCYHCLDCIGCTNCFQCFGLRQATSGYYYRNQKISKSEWETLISSAQFGSFAREEEIKQQSAEFFSPHQDFEQNSLNDQCLQAYRVSNSKDCSLAMYCSNCQDSSGIIFSTDCRDCHVVVWARNCERCYYVLGAANAYDCIFCDGLAGGGKNLAYCFCCYNGCSDLFGCFYLKKQQHCILNKQYSKQEYEALVPKIRQHMIETGEWGNWFPNQFYQVPYSDSWANFFLAQLNSEQILSRGLIPGHTIQRITESEIHLPDHIDQTTEQICSVELKCAISLRPYSISKRELELFKKHRAPLPREHWAETLSQIQRHSASRALKKLEILIAK